MCRFSSCGSENIYCPRLACDRREQIVIPQDIGPGLPYVLVHVYALTFHTGHIYSHPVERNDGSAQLFMTGHNALYTGTCMYIEWYGFRQSRLLKIDPGPTISCSCEKSTGVISVYCAYMW